MPTKDPHIALIDAHEKLEQIKLVMRQAVSIMQAKQARGEVPNADDRLAITILRNQAIEQTKRIQDELYEELEGHGKLS